MNTKTLAAARRAYLAGEIPPVDDVPCVCKAPRSEHAGANHGGGIPDRCARYRADKLAETVAQAAAAAEHGFYETMTAFDRLSRSKMAKKKSGVISVRPSDLGSCRRAVYYRETPPEDYEPAPSPRGAAWMGTLIHEEFLRRRAALYPWRLYADYDDSLALRLPGSDRPYRYDEYDPITARLISCKTAGSWRWDKTGQDGADDKWWDQDHVYAWLLRQKGYPVETIEVLVIERESGKSERFVEPYNEDRALRCLGDLQTLALELELGMVPPRDEPGPSLSKLCSTYCPARNHCWQIERAEELGRSPESLIALGENPEDAAIELIAADLVEAREARLDAEKHEKELKVLLDGVELRPYGEYEPVPGSNTSTAWNEYREQVESWWNEPPELRPEQPPIPRQTKKVSYTWKRLRKATRDAMAKAKKEAEAKAAAEQPAETPAGELQEAS